jgi:iron(III) transport system substrate-binding protein
VLLAALIALLVAGAVIWRVMTGGPAPLVVYCAHDSVYAQPIIDEFERRTGIRVRFVPDTEASKSLGFVQKLIGEKNHPRCDVFWNNEQLGMMDLADEGVLEAYKGEGFARIPAAYKDEAGRWTGFAARMRVWIVNTDRVQNTPEAVGQTLTGKLSRVGIAKPLYGTTRTHYTVQWHKWGGPTLIAWHNDQRARGIIELAGNGPVKNQVAAGTLDLGLTDTDDFFDALDESRPVRMVPFALEAADGEGQAIVIPNTVAVIKGTQRAEDARRLVEFLLSEEVELSLARSKARQVPLGKVDETKLPDEVRGLLRWVKNGYPLSDLGAARKECLEWLRKEYVK